MIDHKKLSLVVPCRNEEAIIGSFIKRIPTCVDEVIVVDNNSTDVTARVARQAGAIVIKEPRTLGGIGYGFAHLAGLARATGDYVVAMDGDDTYPVGQIKKIIRLMEKKSWDFVSCNRLPLTNPRAISRTRQLGITVLNALVWLLYGYPMQDILTGMWVVRKVVVPRLSLREGDWNFSPEIKLAALTAPGIVFAQYHIAHFRREHEISKQNLIKTGFTHLWYIIKRRFTTDNALASLFTQKLPPGWQQAV